MAVLMDDNSQDKVLSPQNIDQFGHCCFQDIRRMSSSKLRNNSSEVKLKLVIMSNAIYEPLHTARLEKDPRSGRCYRLAKFYDQIHVYLIRVHAN